MLQKKIYLDNLASRMKSAGQQNWTMYDMQDLCELADLWSEWIETKTRSEAENLSLKAAKKLDVEIRHYITA